MANSARLRLVDNASPARINGTVRVPPRRLPNKDRRPREHLTEREVIALAQAAGKRGRYGHRDRTMIMMAFRHGLRVSELVDLHWHQVNLDEGVLVVHRLKGRRRKDGRHNDRLPSVHPIPGSEMRELRRLRREQDVGKFAGEPRVFITERGGPMTANAFGRLLTRTAQAARFPFPVHPHMLRHAAGYKLVNESRNMRAIQLYLGHQRVESTEVYTKLAPDQFNGFFR